MGRLPHPGMSRRGFCLPHTSIYNTDLLSTTSPFFLSSTILLEYIIPHCSLVGLYLITAASASIPFHFIVFPGLDSWLHFLATLRFLTRIDSRCPTAASAKAAGVQRASSAQRTPARSSSLSDLRATTVMDPWVAAAIAVLRNLIIDHGSVEAGLKSYPYFA